MTQEEMRVLIEKGFENQRIWLEKLVKSEVSAQLNTHLSLLPDLLVDRIASEHNKGAQGKFNISGQSNARAGLLAVPKGDDDNWSTKDCIEPKAAVPDATDNSKAKEKQGEIAPSKPPPPPPPKTDLKTSPSFIALTPSGVVRDFKVNVLGCPEEGHTCCDNLTTDPNACFSHFVAGPIFSIISSTVILVNTVYIGTEAQASINNQVKRLHNESMSPTSEAGEYFFTIFFMVELSMRVIAQKKMFIYGKDKYWNLFDSILILISLIQLVASAGVNLSVFRIFRIFRLIRLLKVIAKVQLLESLNLMVFGIINCIAPLFWAILILILIMYAFGVFFMSGLTGVLQDMNKAEADLDQVDSLNVGFGSVYRTIASLFEAVTGGNDWAGIAETMRIVSEGLYCCFALYVVFVTLGVLNIVTGFFVDGTMQANVNAREEMLRQAQEKKNNMIQLVGELFMQLDTDQSGKLSYEELDSHLHDEALQEYFCVLEMEPEEAKDLFCLLDIRGEGEVSITDFTNGCLKIMGPPKNLDICTCLYQSRRMLILLESLSASLTGKNKRMY